MTPLNASWLLSLPEPQQQQFLLSLTEEEAEALNFDWEFWARDKQLPPDTAWRVWLVLAGRGFGKTRTGAEFVRLQVESGRWKRVALVAATTADIRDVMVEGESGILAISPPNFRPTYEPSKRRLTWPNGAIATTYSAEEPQRLRGPQHDGAWADEIAAWQYPETWDQLMFGLRLGDNPQAVATTTPKPVKLVVELMQATTTHVTRGTTYENRVNLAPAFFSEIVTKYEGTRLGEQELNAELLDLGGLFFDMWKERIHTKNPAEVQIKPYWNWFGGFDWGKSLSSAYVFLLCCADESGNVIVVDEACEPGKSNAEQAAKIKEILKKHGAPANTMIAADPSIFPAENVSERLGRSIVEDYWAEGLSFVKATNNRKQGWGRVKEFMQTLGALTVLLGRCSELIRALRFLFEPQNDPEDIQKKPKQFDHPADALRYALMTRPRPSSMPATPGPHTRPLIPNSKLPHALQSDEPPPSYE